MLKAYILIVGLIALVPHKDPATGKITSLTALLLDTPTGTTYSWGTPFPAHHPQRSIYFFGSDPRALLNLAGHNIQITAPSQHGEIILPAGLPVVNLTDVFLDAGYLPGQLPTFRKSKCLRINPTDPCNDSKGKNLLAGVVTISGDWSVSTIDINHAHEPVSTSIVVDRSQYSFMAADFLPGKLVRVKRQIAGAVLFETTDPLTSEAALVYKDSANGQFTLPKGACAFVGNPQCLLVKLSNHPTTSTLCSEITEYERIDHHFDRMFELLDYSASPSGRPRRFLPYVMSRDDGAMSILCPGGPAGDPPSIKCPSAIIYP